MTFVEKVYDGLFNFPVQSAAALVIILLALPLIRSGLREKPPAPPPQPVPIEVESAWMIQNLTRMQMDIENIKGRLDVLSSQVKGVAALLKRRERRKPK
ncbi:hypothetical protein [Bradyrhizobium sp. JYMT SZCCT0428]|uniref:hypothetical protein n=1 Tax=Bradyrhizobium sp. JYMT SZCCT0428 TaxID=2807673 RepID=UPI001BACFF8E|nr:hypothetical protein [Bradyrhizobium sp. JYMT SZCCT0428]MBR1150066.1 hypothetical protein [Bradyrhizobium sp. JYMT SZCCT0428]